MDLRVFFSKLRKLEQEIVDPHVIVVSNETADGGRAGIQTEVGRSAAARMILEGKARLATAEESAAYHAGVIESQLLEAERKIAERVQVQLIAVPETPAAKPAPQPVPHGKK